jgi:hypothetical protein
MILVVTRDHEPRGRRVRVLPGVLGTMVGFAGGSTTVDVAVADLRRYLDRVGKELQCSKLTSERAGSSSIKKRTNLPSGDIPSQAVGSTRSVRASGLP